MLRKVWMAISLSLCLWLPASTQPTLFLDLSAAAVADATPTPNLPSAPVSSLEVEPGALVRLSVGFRFTPQGDITRWYLWSAYLRVDSPHLQVVTPDQTDIAENAFWHPQVQQLGLTPQTRAAVSAQTPPLRANLLRPTDPHSSVHTASGALWVVLAPGGSATTEPFFVGHAYLKVAENAPQGTEIPITVYSVQDSSRARPNSLLATDGNVRYHRFGEQLPVQTATLRVVSAKTELVGQVVLQDYTASPQGVPLHVQIREPGSPNATEEYTVRLDDNGGFRVQTSLRGVYDVSLKASHWLRRTLASVNLSGVVRLTASLLNGDVDGDNEVTLFDFGQLVAAFGSTAGDPNWNANADLDGDEEVTLFDFAILVRNFGATGDD
jgi:hypothetical protein